MNDKSFTDDGCYFREETQPLSLSVSFLALKNLECEEKKRHRKERM